MQIVATPTPTEEASKALTDSLRAYPGRPMLLMVSGGSALSLLDLVDISVLGPHITLTVLDERYSTDVAVNNFTQLSETTFFTSCTLAGVHVISTKVLIGESLLDLQLRFDDALHTWKEQYTDGVVVVTVGIGSDGHTAGIFPKIPEVDFDGKDWTVAYTLPKNINPYPHRVTVTNTFLRDCVDEAIVYAVGPEKSILVNTLESSTFSTQEFPAAVLKEISQLRIFTSV